ncbi:pyrimidine/purine nucleoside phosphorylase [Massilia sp. CCM 9210]|uniref:pyrimidine/purine nucleoside phosphorylase n=1 Tax=Massilia scottii TaxID=3057166 RepID=UPI002796689F|nr:pyrimidine/purine nucleoside phosphorylase [Massilia sp. CCM 9210]MDQ1815155.1 pyrimidine/purine nucleoside phosphorylase [Massilia sp. CCM 9210]
MSMIQNVAVSKKSNIYFDGKCVSHTLLLADGSKKTVGVIFPSQLTFNTAAPEVMEIVAGKCRVKLAGSDAWQDYAAGERFSVGANTAFDIDTTETLDYVCHFG